MSRLRDEIAALPEYSGGNTLEEKIAYNVALSDVLAIIDRHEEQDLKPKFQVIPCYDQPSLEYTPEGFVYRTTMTPEEIKAKWPEMKIPDPKPSERPARDALHDDIVAMTLPHDEVVLLAGRAIVEAMDANTAAIRETRNG